jgi:hypothetical protein
LFIGVRWHSRLNVQLDKMPPARAVMHCEWLSRIKRIRRRRGCSTSETAGTPS